MRRRAESALLGGPLLVAAILALAGAAGAQKPDPTSVSSAGPPPQETPPAPRAVAGPLTVPTLAAPPQNGLPLRAAREIRFSTDEGSWLSPDLSPDGRRIAFELLGDLYVVPIEGGAARAITSGLAFDSQPAFSPDGRSLVFVSDRSGGENLWIAGADGGRPRPLTRLLGDVILTSPTWSADGRTVYVSRFRPERVGFELLQIDVATGEADVVLPIEGGFKGRLGRRPASVTTPSHPPEVGGEPSDGAVGAAASRDGRWLYYAAHVGPKDADPPAWVIRRVDLGRGESRTLVSPPKSYRPDLVLGTFFRPLPSPDGRSLVYATRYGSGMWLRVLDLQTRQDRWLAPLGQRDELDALASRDLAPHYAFTPDSQALVVNDGGKLARIALATGVKTPIPFTAEVRLPLGPVNRPLIREDSGPVRARLIQSPSESPDGSRLAFSALGRLYVMPLDGRGAPRRLTDGPIGEYQPSWSPDGRSIVYVRWTARDAGDIWRVPADGSGPSVRVSSVSAYYTNPTVTPDGRSVVAIRSSNAVRMHRYMEYGPLREAELVVMPVQGGGAAKVVADGTMGGQPHFGPAPGRVNLLFDDGLQSVALDGSGRRRLVQVTGPGYYFLPTRAPADDLRLSPDGRWLLVQIAQQLHLLAMPQTLGETIDLAAPGVRHARLTAIGADFLQWSADGRSIAWALGSSWFRRPLAEVKVDAVDSAHAEADLGAPRRFDVDVEVPRDEEKGALLLRGATALTMRGEERIADADVLVVDGRIAAIGRRGTVKAPAGARVEDARGKWVLPGFIDDHDHVADIRRGLLDLESWGPAANLAYGVTTAFDPSTLSIDMLAYQDLIDAGLMIGSRIRSTGPALFSLNEFTSKAQVGAVLDRYRDFYRLRNIKLYRTGERQVRQWIAESARERGLRVTTEGATADKLDLTQIQDGIPGAEHALPAAPLYRDIVQLIARSGVSYNATLMVNGGGQDYFVVEKRPNADPKLNRFAPRFVVEMKTRKRSWKEGSDYLFPVYAEGAARVARAGGLVGMGSHGEIPGLGFHWEMEAHVMGGMRPIEALRAATLGSARAIGREADFGSLEVGKVADLVILDHDPTADIRNTLSISRVIQGGRLYDADTLDQLWPTPRRFPRPWYWDDRPPGTPDPGAAPRLRVGSELPG